MYNLLCQSSETKKTNKSYFKYVDLSQQFQKWLFLNYITFQLSKPLLGAKTSENFSSRVKVLAKTFLGGESFRKQLWLIFADRCHF